MRGGGCGWVALSEFAFMLSGIKNCFPHPQPQLRKPHGSQNFEVVGRRKAVHFHVAASESWSAASSLRPPRPAPCGQSSRATAPGGAGPHLGLCSQLLLRGLVGTGMGWASPCQSKFHPALDLPGLLGEEGWTVRAVWGLRQRT